MTDYPTLQADIADWTARDDLSGKAPTFVKLAEAVIGRRVRTLEQETDVIIVCPSPTFVGPLPAGFLGFKHIYVAGVSNPRTEYVPPTQFHELRNTPRDGLNRLLGDGALLYTIESNAVKIALTAGSPDPVTLDACYITRFPPLSDATPTNWLLDNHYDIYLWAGLLGAWDFIDETEMVAKYQGKLDRAIGELEALEVRKRLPSGPLKRRPAEGSIV